MNAARAHRRWIRWCRYVDKTQSMPNLYRSFGSGAHTGQAKAYEDATFARRCYPKGARAVWYPRWGAPR